MSIQNEITKLDAVRDALVESVNAKGGELPEDATLWQVKAGVDALPQGGGTDAPTVIQPVPSMNLNAATGQVTAEYTPVAGLVEDTSLKSATLQMETLAGQTITPGSTSQTIAGGKFLTGDIVVSAVENSGGSSGGSSGGRPGEGAIVGLFCVSKSKPGYTRIDMLTLSGLYDDSENSGYDLTPANGEYRPYTVEVETEDSVSYINCYKHRSGDYYVYYIPASPDGSYPGYGWALNTSIVMNTMNVLMYTQAVNLQEGTKSWYGEMNMLAMPVTLTFTSTTQVPADIRGHFVRRKMMRAEQEGSIKDNYNSFYYEKIDDTVVAITSCDEEPEVHEIYAVTQLPDTDGGDFGGYHLSGKPVANEGGEHLLMYVPWNAAGSGWTRIYNPRGSASYLCADAWKFPTMYPGSGSNEYHMIHTITDPGNIGGRPITNPGFFLYGTDHDRYEITTPHGGTDASGIDRIGKFVSLPWDADRHWSITMMFSACYLIGLERPMPRIRPMRVISGSQLICVDVLPSEDALGYDLIVYNNDNPIITLPKAITWSRGEADEFGITHPLYHAYFCALTYDFDVKTLKVYLSGPYGYKGAPNLAGQPPAVQPDSFSELPAAGEYTNLHFGPTSENKFDPFLFGIGHQNGDYVLGYYSEIKVWDIPLTPLQIGAELYRIITLEEEE